MLIFFDNQKKYQESTDKDDARFERVKNALIASGDYHPDKLYPEFFPKSEEEAFDDLDFENMEWSVPSSPEEWAKITEDFRSVTVPLVDNGLTDNGPMPNINSLPKFSSNGPLDFSGIPDGPRISAFDNEREWS